MADLSGQSLGRYHLLERLGEGGMATVYKAYDVRLEREVAVKIIRRDAFPPDTLEEVLKRFEREAKSLARLSHPNIVRVHDYGEYEGAPYLVLEYLPGGTLKNRLGTPHPWQEVIRLLLPISGGIAYAHQHGILHRDIKPANILITEAGQPMLSDFGIAKIFEEKQVTALTASGMIVGTPEYMAPEQWTGLASPQSDMYALGIVLYEMVTGRKPYVADTPAAILLKQATEPLPRPGTFVSGLPEAVEWFLIKVLAKEPADRYEDMPAMLKAMEDLLALPAASAPPGPQEHRAPAPPEKAAPVTPAGQKAPPEDRPPSKGSSSRLAGCLPGAVLILCLLAVLVGGSLSLWLWKNPPASTEPPPTPAASKSARPTIIMAAPLPLSPVPPDVQLFDGSALDFSDKPDVIAYANNLAFAPPAGVTIRDNCEEAVCWRYGQWLALRSPGGYVEAFVEVSTEMGVQFWGDTNDGIGRVLIDGQEIWRGDTHGTDTNWPGGMYVKYLHLSGLQPGPHTLRVEDVGPGDVTVRLFGFGPVAP